MKLIAYFRSSMLRTQLEASCSARGINVMSDRFCHSAGGKECEHDSSVSYRAPEAIRFRWYAASDRSILCGVAGAIGGWALGWSIGFGIFMGLLSIILWNFVVWFLIFVMGIQGLALGAILASKYPRSLCLFAGAIVGHVSGYVRLWLQNFMAAKAMPFINAELFFPMTTYLWTLVAAGIGAVVWIILAVLTNTKRARRKVAS